MRNNFKSLNYMLAWTIPLSGVVALSGEGVWAWSSLIYAFGIIPIVDHLLPQNSKNIPTEHVLEDAGTYDFIILAILPIQLGLLSWFLAGIGSAEITTVTYVGRIASMGVMCGVLGINVAHELGHRVSLVDQTISKILLSTSLYSHFFIEHNFGHHRDVCTPKDSATARRGEWLLPFVFRSSIGGWMNSWRIESRILKRKGKSILGFSNQVLIWQIIQWGILGGVFCYLGNDEGIAWLSAAAIGAFLLEAINYIEHYGLVREKVTENRYEKVQHHHSWNSNHVMGRRILFELTRHSDHHYAPSKIYPTLNSPEDAPQLPTGYPGMMLLSLLSPLYIWIMNKKIDAF